VEISLQLHQAFPFLFVCFCLVLVLWSVASQ
jgi:hypothetical protein